MTKNFTSLARALRCFLVITGSVDFSAMESAPRFALLFWAGGSGNPSAEEVTRILAMANLHAKREALHISRGFGDLLSRGFGAVPPPAEFTVLSEPLIGWAFTDDAVDARLIRTAEGWAVETEGETLLSRTLRKRWRQAARLAK